MLIIIIAILSSMTAGYLFNRRFYINGEEIIISHNPFGIERISVAGKTIYKKFSFSGSHQEFLVGDSKCEVDYYFKQLGLSVGITVRKDGKILYSDK